MSQIHAIPPVSFPDEEQIRERMACLQQELSWLRKLLRLIHEKPGNSLVRALASSPSISKRGQEASHVR